MSRVTLPSNFSIHEASARIIEQSIETSLQQLRDEKKEEMKLDRQIKKLESQIYQRKASLSPSTETEELQKYYAIVKKKVEASFSSVNSLQAENKLLKDKIEDMRLEIQKNKRVVSGLEQDLSSSTSLARACSQSKIREIHAEEENKQKLHKCLSKSTTAKTTLIEKISKLSTMIKKDKLEQATSLKKHSDLMAQQVNRPLTALETERINAYIKEHKAHKLKQIKSKLESYLQKIQDIKKGFRRIFSAFSSSTYQDLVNDFIASEQRMRDVQLHLIKLSGEIEGLQLTNNNIYSSLVKSKSDSSEKSNELYGKITKELRIIRNKTDLTNFKTNAINKEIEKAGKKVEHALMFYKKISKNDGAGIGDINTEGSIEDKLMTLEQIVHHILLNKAFLKKQFSTFGTMRSSILKEKPESFVEVKNFIESNAIIEEPEFEESSPQNVITLRARAKFLYNKISRNETPFFNLHRSYTPNPASAHL